MARVYTAIHRVYVANKNCDCASKRQTCDCNEDARGRGGMLGLLARDASRVVSGRVTNAVARALGNYCSTHRCTQSEALRNALTILSADGDDPETVIAAVAAALSLPEDTPPEDVLAKFQELVTAAGHQGVEDHEAAAEIADSVPPPPGSATPPAPPRKNPTPPMASLSKWEIAECAKAGMPISEYLAARNRMAQSNGAPHTAPVAPVKQLSRAELEGIKRLGITPEEYRERMANCVRRI